MAFFIIFLGLSAYYILIYYYSIKPRQKELEKSNKKLKLLYELSVNFHESVALENSLEKILSEILGLVNAEVASLFLLDRKNGHFSCAVAVGPTADEVLKLKIPYGAGIVSKVEKEKAPILCNDVETMPEHFKNIDEKLKFKTKSMICVPLFIKDDFMGAIQIINKKSGNSFENSDIEILSTISNIAALAIHNVNIIKNYSR
ncbi:MAG: GAF domain-containing protein [Candidatus Wallbacteria bacterium]